MTAIFISHSSSDKPFVRRLAVDLLQEGLPVWLDEWELDISDSLIQRIYDSIADSSYFILVISSASISSGWVLKEMTAALTREEQISRRFLIPILLDDSVPPLQIADRLYADFSKGYFATFEKLVRRLKSEGLHRMLPSQNRIVVPLTLVQDTYLDTDALQKLIEHLRPLFQGGRCIEPRDVYVCTSTEYQSLRSKLVHRMEHIAEDPFYSPQFELDFRNFYRFIIDLERKYTDGVCLIINNLLLTQSTLRWTAYEALKWFSLFWRSELLACLHNAQNPKDPNRVSYGSNSLRDRFATDCRSYGQAVQLGAMDIGPVKNGIMLESFRVYIDPELRAYEDTHLSIERLLSYDASLMSKYVIPQMVARMVDDDVGPFSWSFENYGIARG